MAHTLFSEIEMLNVIIYGDNWKVEMLIEGLHVCNTAQAFDCHGKELSEWKHTWDDEKDTILANRPVHQ